MSMLYRQVLVLNQNFEPVSVCSVRRAVVMLYLGKAEIIETADGFVLRSQSTQIPVPSVIRLDFYVKVPAKRIMLTRKNIIKRDGSRCQYCGRKKSQMTVDHIIPKIYGGKDTWENLVCACLECNNRKGHQTPEHAGLLLVRRPRRPNHITFIQQFVGVSDHRWRQYLFMD
ncbi:MAG: HNH endonuclease [candidate division Zixibacteria bacterium RBG_16_53_22]|nr:MAG: HNH endonuclease [candidate division Zixibacteria bacterium RBG_16_53_22]